MDRVAASYTASKQGTGAGEPSRAGLFFRARVISDAGSGAFLLQAGRVRFIASSSEALKPGDLVMVRGRPPRGARQESAGSVGMERISRVLAEAFAREGRAFPEAAKAQATLRAAKLDRGLRERIGAALLAASGDLGARALSQAVLALSPRPDGGERRRDARRERERDDTGGGSTILGAEGEDGGEPPSLAEELALSAVASGDSNGSLPVLNHLGDQRRVFIPFNFELDGVGFAGMLDVSLPVSKGGSGALKAVFEADGEAWELALRFPGADGQPSLAVECPKGMEGPFMRSLAEDIPRFSSVAARASGEGPVEEFA
jgi:hypothetical protein